MTFKRRRRGWGHQTEYSGIQSPRNLLFSAVAICWADLRAIICINLALGGMRYHVHFVASPEVQSLQSHWRELNRDDDNIDWCLCLAGGYKKEEWLQYRDKWEVRGDKDGNSTTSGFVKRIKCLLLTWRRSLGLSEEKVSKYYWGIFNSLKVILIDN